MKKLERILSTTLLGLSALLVTPLSSAHDRDDWRHDRHEYRHDNGRHYSHRDRIYGREVIIREPRIIREPVYVREPVYYRERPVYRRNPAVVIDVDLPPLIFPLR